jgi:hypothetical protein
VHPVLARTSQSTTRPAPQAKDLRHGQLLYSGCTVGSGGLLRKPQKRIEPTIGLESMTCRFQIGTFGLDVLCLERAALEFQITIEQLGDFAGRALAQRSPYKPTHLRTVIRTAKKSRYVACSMQSYRVPTECTQADGPVKIISFCGGVRFPKADLAQVLLGHK